MAKDNTQDKRRISTLRKLAEEAKVPGWEDMERLALLEALKNVGNESGKERQEENKQDSDSEALGLEGSRTPLGGKAEAMKKALAKQPKVTIMIPLLDGEKSGTTFSVILNGYRLNIRKGMYVEVPKQVADVIKDSQKQAQVLVEHPNKLEGTESELTK